MLPDPTVDAIGGLSHAKILCIGDVMLDRFFTGAVDRISPEAPVPVFRAGRMSSILGGAGNVARNIAALGAGAVLIGATGDDDAATEIAALLRREPLIEPVLIADPCQPTTLKSRYVAGGNHILRIDTDPSGPLDVATRAQLEQAFYDGLATAGAAVISDYGKGVLPEQAVQRMIAKATAAGCPVVVDPKGSDYARYRGASVVTPNRKELAEAAGRRLDDEAAMVAAAESLVAAHGFGAMLVTRGEEGMSLVLPDRPPRHFATEAAEVFDVAGAGDTVVAVLATGLASGLPLETAVALSNIAAGIVVRKIGTAVASQRELRIALRRRAVPTSGKLVDLPDCLELVEQWRSDGFRVGFTNGCFDVLHAGHIELLRKSKRAVDKLVLGLNSDSSVRGLKGVERPINPQEARARVLSAIEFVDAIVVFGEATPERLIEEIRPDVLMKGSDYRIDQVVGGDYVRGYGGSVQLIDLVAGFSSTAIVEKLKRVAATAG